MSSPCPPCPPASAHIHNCAPCGMPTISLTFINQYISLPLWMGIILAAPGTRDLDADNAIAEATRAVREATSPSKCSPSKCSPSKRLKGTALTDTSTLQLPQLPSTALPCFQCMYNIFAPGLGGGGSMEHKGRRCRKDLMHTGADYLLDARYDSHQSGYRTRAPHAVQQCPLRDVGVTDTDSVETLHEINSPKRGPGRPRKDASLPSSLRGAWMTNARPKGMLARLVAEAKPAIQGRPWKPVHDHTSDMDSETGDLFQGDANPDMPPRHLSSDSHLQFSLTAAFGKGVVPPVIYRRQNLQGHRTVCFILPASINKPDGSSDLNYVTDSYNPLYLTIFSKAGCVDVHVACNKCDVLMQGLPKSLPGHSALFHMCKFKTTQGGSMCGCGRTLLQHVKDQATEQDLATDTDTFEHIYTSAPDWVPEFDTVDPGQENEFTSILKVPLSHQGTVPFPYRVLGDFGTPSCGVVTRGPRFAWRCTSCSKMFGCPHRSILRSQVENLYAGPKNQQLFYKRSSAERFDVILRQSVGKDGRLLNLTYSKLPIPDVPTEKVMKKLKLVPLDNQTFMKMREFSPSQISAMAYYASVGPKPPALANRFAYVASSLDANSTTVLLCDQQTEACEAGFGAASVDNNTKTFGEGKRCNGVLFTCGGVMPCTVQSFVDPATGLETHYDGNSDAVINVDDQ